MSVYDHEYAEQSTRDDENIVCPYCMHRFSDSWELFDSLEGDLKTTCHSCDAKFMASRTVRFTYVGRKLDIKPTEAPGE